MPTVLPGCCFFFPGSFTKYKEFPLSRRVYHSKTKEYLSPCLSLCLLFWLTSFHKPRTFPPSVFLPHCLVIQSPCSHFSPWKLHHLQAYVESPFFLRPISICLMGSDSFINSAPVVFCSFIPQIWTDLCHLLYSSCLSFFSTCTESISERQAAFLLYCCLF